VKGKHQLSASHGNFYQTDDVQLVFVILPAAEMVLWGNHSALVVTKYGLIHILSGGYAGKHFPPVIKQPGSDLISYVHMVPKLRICGPTPPLSRKHS
jgi:hypothetical protein